MPNAHLAAELAPLEGEALAGAAVLPHVDNAEPARAELVLLKVMYTVQVYKLHFETKEANIIFVVWRPGRPSPPPCPATAAVD